MFHLESGARREGAFNLCRRDLDHCRAWAWLREKFSAEREQPISPSLVRRLDDRTNARGGHVSDDAVFTDWFMRNRCSWLGSLRPLQHPR